MIRGNRMIMDPFGCVSARSSVDLSSSVADVTVDPQMVRSAVRVDLVVSPHLASRGYRNQGGAPRHLRRSSSDLESPHVCTGG